MNNQLDHKITLGFLMKFTFPSILMMVIMSLYTVVDGTFVSRLIGTDAFSAVNLVYPIVSVTIGIGTMFASGLSAVLCRKLGQGRKLEADRDLSFVLVCAVGLGVILAVVCLLFLDPLLIFLGANSQVMAYCRAYALPLILFFPFSIVQLIFQSLYAADGAPHLGLITTLAGGIVNIVLDAVFIISFHWGIAGAAIATGLGYALPALFGFIYFALGKRNLKFAAPVWDWPLLLEAAANGSSEMISNLSTSVTTFLFNIIMMRLIGQDGVAAIAILLYLDFILIAVNLGYAMGVAPLISYNYGKGRTTQLKKIVRLSLGFCTGTGVLMTLLTWLLTPQLTAVFTSPQSSVYALAAAGLQIYAVSYLFKGYNVFASALFTAFGNSRISALLSGLRTLVFLTGTLIVMAVLFGVNGVWAACPIVELLALGVSVWALAANRSVYDYY